MDDADSRASEEVAASQRRSGRVVRPPTKYLPATTGTTAKRKRLGGAEAGDDEDDEIEDGDEAGGGDESAAEDDDDEDDNNDDDDDDNDGDHHGGAGANGSRRSQAKRKTPSSQARKRAAKKPKLNGASHLGASLPSRPKKALRVSIETDGEHTSRLYADIFASGDDSADVAARWFESFQENNAAAVADLVNCILSSAGCDHHVTDDDINDPDNCSNRLTELQGIYEEQKITDYPLIAKSRSTRSFRELLVQFFHAFINVLHETETLYVQPQLMENVVRWVASLSSSTLRPFRHTATTVALAMLAALNDVAKKLDERINKMTQQVEAQKGRQGKKGKDSRLTAFENSLKEASRSRERAAELMKEFFDVVFVHRYRDIDPRIRSECAEALGLWVWTLPSVYMQPEYLRYLGWMLTDSSPMTRQEVLRQLSRVFRRDANKMGHFIDRFRPRLIEIATRDADIGVRVTAIGVIEQLRPSGMLDPDEIDKIGRLIFDSELRVRKAAVNFFAECVNESAAAMLDEVGGEEAMRELFGRGQSKTGQYDAPRRDWINVKSLASTIAAYEEQLSARLSNSAHPSSYGLDVVMESASAVVPETSRLALASQVLVDKISEISNWEILAGYLLYDHSVETAKGRSRSKSKTAETTFRAAIAPTDQEEVILLEILATATKMSFASGAAGSGGDGFRRRAGGGAGGGGGGGAGSGGGGGSMGAGAGLDGPATAGDSAGGDATGLQLAALIPQLLRKFGAEPATAVTVLRLQHGLDLEVFRQLRQDAATFDVLLDEICTQFSRHADSAVISEATASLLHARQYEELEEVVDSKVSALWESVINSLRNFDKTCELSVRRNLSLSLATELSVTLFKISKLASISDCVDMLEADGTSAESSAPAIDILVKTVHRGKFEEVDEGLDNVEDALTANAIRACQFYFMWKMRALILAVDAKATIANAAVDRLSVRKRAFDQNLVHTFSSRGYNDDLRLFATGSYCDLHVLFASLRRHLSAPGSMAKYVHLGRLVDQAPPGLVKELISIFDKAERSFARKTKKTLNDPGDDEDPVGDLPDEDDDEDEEDEDGDEDDDGEEGDKGDKDDDKVVERRRAAELQTERALCDLTSHYVMAIVAGVLDQSGPQAGRLRRRLLRNQNKLGHSYKEIVLFLDEKKASEALLLSQGRKKSAARNKGKEVAAAAAAVGATSKGATTATTTATTTAGAAAATATAETPPATAPGITADTPVASSILEDEDLLATPEPEEGTLEDLQRRELVDIELDDDDDDEGQDNHGAMDEDESILGD